MVWLLNLSLASVWPSLLSGSCAALLASPGFFLPWLSRFFIHAPALPLFGRFQCGLVLSLCSVPVFLLGVLPPDFQRPDFLASTVGDADADAASRC